MALNLHSRKRRCAVFRRWINHMIQSEGIELSEFEDVKSGVPLIRLMERISGLRMKEDFYQEPRNRQEALQNVHAFSMFAFGAGLNLTSIMSADDVVDSHTDRVLNVVWLLVRYFYIFLARKKKSYDEGTVQAYVLTQLNTALAKYRLQADNLGSALADGFLLLHLIASYDGHLVNVGNLDRSKADQNVEKALDIANESLGVPTLLTPSDLRADRGPDEMCVILYLLVFFDVAKNPYMRSLEDLNQLQGNLEARDLRHATLQRELESIHNVEKDLEKDKNELKAHVQQVVDEKRLLQQAVTMKLQERTRLLDQIKVKDATITAAMGEGQRVLDLAQKDMERIKEEKVVIELELNQFEEKKNVASKEIEALIHKVQFDALDKVAAGKVTKATPPTGWVTLMFTDIEDAAIMWDADSELMSKALAVHHEIVRKCVVAANGFEVKTESDAFMLAFTDSHKALGCALAVQEALLACETWPEKIQKGARGYPQRVEDANGKLLFQGLRVRMGLHAGIPQCIPDPVTGRMDYFGPMVNRAARVASAARGGEIVISDAVHNDIKDRLGSLGDPVIRDRGMHAFKGLSSEVLIYQVLPRTLEARVFGENTESKSAAMLYDPVATLQASNRALLERMHIMDQEFINKNSSAKLLQDEMNKVQRLLNVTALDECFSTLHQMLTTWKADSETLSKMRADNDALSKDVDEMKGHANHQVAHITRLARPAHGHGHTLGSPSLAPHDLDFSHNSLSSTGSLDKERTETEWRARIADLEAKNAALKAANAQLLSDVMNVGKRSKSRVGTLLNLSEMTVKSDSDLSPHLSESSPPVTGMATAREKSRFKLGGRSSSMPAMPRNPPKALSVGGTPRSNSPPSERTITHLINTDPTLLATSPEKSFGSPQTSRRNPRSVLPPVRPRVNILEETAVALATVHEDMQEDSEVAKASKELPINQKESLGIPLSPVPQRTSPTAFQGTPYSPGDIQPGEATTNFVKEMLELTLSNVGPMDTHHKHANRFEDAATAPHYAHLLSQLKSIVETIFYLFEITFFPRTVLELCASIKREHSRIFNSAETATIVRAIKSEARRLHSSTSSPATRALTTSSSNYGSPGNSLPTTPRTRPLPPLDVTPPLPSQLPAIRT